MAYARGSTKESPDKGFVVPWASIPLSGVDLLRHSKFNKGLGFTHEERLALRLRGLLPPVTFPIEQQVQRVVGQVKGKATDLERFIYLNSLCDRNETLFYRTVIDNISYMMPFLYTPTVGLACQRFSTIFRKPRGLYISALDKGHILEILRNWPETNVKTIVVTDGERILGLGDLGCQGMGIPVGKLALYIACAGIHPGHTLPIQIDVGTNNQSLLDSEDYIGLRQARVRGKEYEELIAEFVDAVRCRYGETCLIQWEDFGNENAFWILHKYIDKQCSFNDDIQGTASVALAGTLGALKLTGSTLSEQTILFLGAGEAGVGIADLHVHAMMQDGLSEEAARKKVWLVDSKGLITKQRPGKLQHHKEPYAHDAPEAWAGTSLLQSIDELKPTVLIGVSTIGGSFTQEVVQKMAAINKRPVVFALSNPTSCAECTAEQAYQWSEGRAIYASGSPFPPCELFGKKFVPGQGNNAYVFPGIGMGALCSGSRRVTDNMMLTAAYALADLVLPEDLELTLVYPPLTKIREVSAHIAAKVAEEAYAKGFATVYPKPDDIPARIKSLMYDPRYPQLI